MNIADIRKDYTLQTLEADKVHHSPIAQFQTWLQEAIKAALPEPTAMNIATVSAEGKPSARIVLLKGVENNGFIFFTNYESKKGKDLATNPFACLTFHWAELERQVRIEGKIEKIANEQSEQYFNSRPVGSRIGAHASPQSQVIESREWLENRVNELTATYANKTVKRPENWGGYILYPSLIEFWQGRASRLHDRILYTRVSSQWQINRLAP